MLSWIQSHMSLYDIIVEGDLITACLWHRGICGEPLTRHRHHSLSQGGRVQISCYLEYKAICSCMSSIIVEGDLITACLWHRGICGEPLTRHRHHSLSQGGRVQISCYLEYKAICSCMSSIIVEGDLITACLWHRGICGEPLARHRHHSLSQAMGIHMKQWRKRSQHWSLHYALTHWPLGDLNFISCMQFSS